ncbi:MAG: hypothetical protein OXG74_07605 [Acidobacteria bacterium]|nr:hypothetical protein [Acidobacteriota bacterium]
MATAFEHGWSDLRNGDLLDRAEAAGFELLITTDQQLRYEQDLSGRSMAVLVLLTTSWPRISRRVEQVAAAVARMQSGDYEEVNIE